MNMMRLLLLLLVLIGATNSYGQSDTELKKRAKEFFAWQRYDDALKTLQSSRNLSRNDAEGRFLIALCQYQLHRLDEAATILQALVEKEKSPFPECWFYLGKIFHARHQFAEAGRHFKVYLKNIPPDHPNRRMVVDIIRRCAFGQEMQYKPARAYVENLGRDVNSPYDEFLPVVSPNHEDRLYFSSIRPGNIGGKRNERGTPDEQRGQYASDMFFCQNQRGTWTNAQPMPYQLNGPQHEILLDFNKDGSALIYFRGPTLQRGDLLIDTFRQLEERLISTDPFLTPIDTRNGDGTPFLFNDTLIFFASTRPGGYGGSDLYKSAWRNGRWTSPENLGPDINTPYDETSPFFCRDNKTLYFSSNHSERSIGGLDIFKSVYVPDLQRWTEPVNLGIPINSAADDEHFRLANDGFTGFFSSSRKDGFGMRDLYIAYFNDYLIEQEMPIAAYVTYTPIAPPPVVPVPQQVDTVPASASNSTAETASNELFFSTPDDLRKSTAQNFFSNINRLLGADRNRKIVLSVYALRSSYIPDGLFMAIGHAEKIAEQLTRAGTPTDAIFLRAALPEPPIAHPEADFALKFAIMGDEVLASKGPPKAPFNAALEQDLHYKVQIVATKSAYKSPLLQDFAHPMIEKTLDFPYLRYTVGAVDNFAAAQRLQKDLVARGVSGAHIAAYIFGRRTDAKEARAFVSQFPDLKNYAR